jgi:hypothetical protein
MEMYTRFLETPHFLGWLRDRKRITEQQVRSTYIDTLCVVDIARVDWSMIKNASRIGAVRGFDLFLAVHRELVWAGRSLEWMHDPVDSKTGGVSLLGPAPPSLPRGPRVPTGKSVHQNQNPSIGLAGSGASCEVPETHSTGVFYIASMDQLDKLERLAKGLWGAMPAVARDAVLRGAFDDLYESVPRDDDDYILII